MDEHFDRGECPKNSRPNKHIQYIRCSSYSFITSISLNSRLNVAYVSIDFPFCVEHLENICMYGSRVFCQFIIGRFQYEFSHDFTSIPCVYRIRSVKNALHKLQRFCAQTSLFINLLQFAHKTYQ